ncbi:hypothetical protein AHAS_Ahas19G0244500 [Arachis hypogaea]
MASDATYKKNKYKFLMVVFSGVNHHFPTIVFGSAIMAYEGEGTYIWLLQRFVEAMNGKRPDVVIIDGAKAMKLAIERVFLDVHHRLCGWHLLRNATANVSNPRSITLMGLKICGHNSYERQVLCQVENYIKWMHLLRNNEAETDYYISYGFSIIQTQVQALERLGQFYESAVVDELQGHNAILRDCIEQLTAIESSRASLVSHLREALQEQACLRDVMLLLVCICQIECPTKRIGITAIAVGLIVGSLAAALA